MLQVLLMVMLVQGVQAQTGTVTGILRTSKGEPLEGIRVAVSSVEDSIAGSVLESLSLSDASGRFLLENVSPGRYRVIVGKIDSAQYFPGVTSLKEATIFTVTAGSAVNAGEMIFPRSSVSGNVKDLVTGAGRRIRSLQLCCDDSEVSTITAASGLFNVRTATARLTAAVADDGSFVFPSVTAGGYRITAADPEIIPTVYPVIVGTADVEGLEIRVSTGASVSGRVTDQTGTGLSAALQLVPSPENRAFEVAETTSSPVVLSASGTFATIWSQIVGSPGALRSQLTLGPGPVPTLEELRTVLYGLAKTLTVIAESDGSFSFDKVLPGKYTLTYTSIGQSFQREIEIGPEGLTNIDVPLPLTLVIGSLIAEGGAPLPKLRGAIRFVELAPDGKIIYGFPDDEGRLSVLLPTGEFRLFAESVVPAIKSVRDGPRDILNSTFTFDGASDHVLEIVVEPGVADHPER